MSKTDDGTSRKAPTRELPDDIAKLSYEKARDELLSVVSVLESGEKSLDDALALWERGELLATRCEQFLDDAQQRVSRSSSDVQ